MANKSLENAFFYNSQDGDRIYDADSFEYWLKKFFTTGVFEGDLQVKATTGMNVTVGSGYCNLDGKVKIWDTPTSFSLEVADELYDRIDSIVIQRNDTNREITIIKKTGSPAYQPVAPELTRSNGIYEIQLAQIRLNAGMISLTQSSITDTRTNKDLCGYVTGTVKNLDFSELNAQFNAYFSEFKDKNENEFVKWFEKIKGQLSSDAAGKLQAQLDDKISKGELDEVKRQLASKADASDLSGKANRTELELLQRELNGKASNSDLNELNQQLTTQLSYKADNNTVTAMQRELDQKLESTDLDPVKALINKKGFVSSYQLSFTTNGSLSQTAIFSGDRTSDDYKVYLNFPSSLTLEQIQAIGECIPWITGVQYSYNTQVTVQLKSGKLPKTSFSVQVVMEYVGQSK